MSLSSQVVVITGGSRGIGRSMVSCFRQKGARVYFTFHRHTSAAEKTASDFGAEAVSCDQTDGAAVENAATNILEREGRIDILVNNAGITDDQYLMMMQNSSWEKVLDTNLGGAFRWSKAVCRPMMMQKKGVILSVASVSGIVGIGGQTNYAASKGALISFSRSLAAELGPKNIRVNTLVPGFIDTDMTARMPRQIKRQNLERILLKRFGTGEEVARTAVFLASEEAAYITGQTIVVDGGLSSTVA